LFFRRIEIHHERQKNLFFVRYYLGKLPLNFDAYFIPSCEGMTMGGGGALTTTRGLSMRVGPDCP
jgi:hypothetical protein